MRILGTQRQITISMLLALLMALSSITALGVAANATTLDASVGLDFGGAVASGEDIL